MGSAMFRFERTVDVKTAADMPAAMQFAGEVTAYLNKAHSLNMKFGAEAYGVLRIHWFYEFESLDKSAAIGMALLQDRAYQEVLNKAKGHMVEGSTKDTLVSLAN
jgi:hypothetical protein